MPNYKAKWGQRLKTCKSLWFPISELSEAHSATMIFVASPKLINAVTNPEGVATGWVNLAERTVLVCTHTTDIDNNGTVYLSLDDITHFIVIEGPPRFAKLPATLEEAFEISDTAAEKLSGMDTSQVIFGSP